MRNWIAGAMTVLGTLLVLGGAVTIILRAWWKPAADDAQPASAPSGADLFSTAPVVPAPDTRPARLFGRLDAPERLIAWGIVLLVLAAVAAGAIGFNLGASAPVK
ncbi:MAG TPA: hypothetical protein VGJ07_33700 [Rugosimonospora sp.]|jgi:hypothetical protein